MRFKLLIQESVKESDGWGASLPEQVQKRQKQKLSEEVLLYFHVAVSQQMLLEFLTFLDFTMWLTRVMEVLFTCVIC